MKQNLVSHLIYNAWKKAWWGFVENNALTKRKPSTTLQMPWALSSHFRVGITHPQGWRQYFLASGWSPGFELSTYLIQFLCHVLTLRALQYQNSHSWSSLTSMELITLFIVFTRCSLITCVLFRQKLLWKNDYIPWMRSVLINKWLT